MTYPAIVIVLLCFVMIAILCLYSEEKNSSNLEIQNLKGKLQDLDMREARNEFQWELVRLMLRNCNSVPDDFRYVQYALPSDAAWSLIVCLAEKDESLRAPLERAMRMWGKMTEKRNLPNGWEDEIKAELEKLRAELSRQ